jgi:cytochrome c oxidase cbb3-type subunit I/II
VGSPTSAFSGVLQSEQAFLSRAEEGLGSEYLLIHEIMRLHQGRFLAQRQGNQVGLVLELSAPDSEEMLRSVLLSRAYEVSTFEGPLLSIKSVNALAHYTDWIIGHVHSGTLGWNAFMTFGMIYWLLPKLWKRPLYSVALANTQFWMGLLGIVLYVVTMWASGITQGLMLRAITSQGTLMYPDFVETVLRIQPLYWIRAFAGVLFLGSFILMLYNVAMTVRGTRKEELSDESTSAPALRDKPEDAAATPHRRLEGLPTVFAVLTALALLVGGIIEIVPSFFSSEFAAENPGVKPYTPLELAGRDIYVREGCYVCHSQMIRPMAHETLRYGAPSEAEESMYDHPFQWGSRRTGPDLARVGGKYPNLWHFRHMLDPRDVVPQSLMPSYGWLFKAKFDMSCLPKKLKVMKKLGVPYTDTDVEMAEQTARIQAAEIARDLEAQGIPATYADKEIIPLIAYLQRLGADHRKGLVKHGP